MIRGLTKVIAQSANIDRDSVLELLFDRDNEEVFTYKHKKTELKYNTFHASGGSDTLSTVLLATIQGPVTSEWIINQLVQYNCRYAS
ncbi:MAG: hypothetical protein K6F05_05135 [Succinivibrio sp.]|nr:hypothetical protein [Succinivibrio sp.]